MCGLEAWALSSSEATWVISGSWNVFFTLSNIVRMIGWIGGGLLDESMKGSSLNKPAQSLSKSNSVISYENHCKTPTVVR